ncbi:MAG: (2Fe-2S) ferredoxin domain-containing protein [Planctomycetes bacterium]|nr:(2Fe-2S) ferredoxin domain-containing protein [Planctomycetota bacterium]
MSNRLCYVCEGGDCTEKGSGEVFDQLRDLIKKFDPAEERIKIRRYPCFGACDQGINVTLYPDKIFYSKVTVADLPEIAAHIEGKGEPVVRMTGKCQSDVEQIIWDMLDSPY